MNFMCPTGNLRAIKSKSVGIDQRFLSYHVKMPYSNMMDVNL